MFYLHPFFSLYIYKITQKLSRILLKSFRKIGLDFGGDVS